MRILLASAVAVAPLLAASGAMAEIVISTARTTPITTANATGTGPDSIRMASGGSIAVNTGVAVTVNSSHSFKMDAGSSITMASTADNSTAVLVNGGNTANVSIAGAISLTDNVAADADLDTDNDGDLDGPFATGTGRYGLRLAGASPLTGDVVLESGGQIAVEGNDSYGVSLEAPLTGSFSTIGGVQVTGNNSYGVRTTGDVSGRVNLVGGITARGENAVGASIEGDVGGALRVHSALSATGYRYTTRPTVRPDGYVEPADDDDNILLLDELDADDLLQGGPALRIQGNIGGGVLLDIAPAYRLGIEGDDDGDGVKNGDEDDDGDGTINRSDTDRDGDGLLDTLEGSAAITSLGGAPAVEVGSTTRSITLGVAGAGDSAYGFINRGSVAGQGIYDGVAGQGIVFGGNAGQTVTIAGGVRNEGSIGASSEKANATAIRFGQGAVAPTLSNTSTISAGVASDTAATATAVLIDAGASVASLSNSGTILAAVSGGVADGVAIRDRSGSLASVQNTGSIVANVAANADGDAVTGRATAIDVAANTTGFTLIQSGTAGTATDTDPDTDGDGVPDSLEPQIVGAVNLGAGADTLDIRNGLVLGDIAFGAGADSLAITGGARVAGELSDSDGALSIDVSNGTLQARQLDVLNLTSLNVGADGNLIITIDPANNTSGYFNVAGNATLADGAGLGVRFNSLLEAPGRFTLIDATSLNYGAVDLESLQENSPFLYVVEGGADAATAQVYADVRRRTAEEADLIPVEAQMFDAFYGAISSTDAEEVRNAFLAQTNRADFGNLYEQLLPDHSGGPLLSLASGVDAVTRALTGRNAAAAPGETSAWVQEINFYADKDQTDTYGFRSEGFGVAGGVERGSGLGNIGLSVAFTSSDLEDPEAEAEEVLSANLLELGLYWRAQGQYWTTWARAAAGYASFTSERRLVGEGLNLSNESDWNGMTLAAAGGLSYEREFGRFTIRPEAYAEYFSLSEDGHVEEGGGDGFDLEIDDREGHMFSATAAINFGMKMGQNDWLRPEVRVGWRQNISVDPGETIARFRAGGGDFTLTPDTIEGGGPILGFRLNVGNELGMLSVSADAEMIDDYVRYMLFLRASFRF
ncbi:MAG: autotransporter outer membrane beta-barrel domain-containing protein [Alphaproteobacteria bacterium]|nr:autotransporter outer membrane beta-barrel domain-containing protein [Alphaproteobacteria bacterium]MBU2270417.1 autotransporter outer membrane beta-barrel domain-containing protein [Alphaproteobacteria bacterium]MBU2419270.1 autotransporter outer membrane beta-barrel domain-containing protein [Alphaproteobacteria bacterium]